MYILEQQQYLGGYFIVFVHSLSLKMKNLPLKKKFLGDIEADLLLS